ncbi:MAG: TIR domain-containing protein [Thermocaproicibacter melissae]|uniref:hypothetical protein n=1 Tax=Thermocaproicibacter melissae TaxID=2966552 RepID=UPI003A101119
MYNKSKIDRLISFITERNGIGDKELLADAVQREFGLEQDRKLYYCDDFALRFSKSEKKRMSNTVLSLSALQKYDDRPVIVCIVSKATNYLMLANTTFLQKISHSSQNLRVDNIRGSFNGSDILEFVDGIENSPENFPELFAMHSSFTFQENLERLVEATNGIAGRARKFVIGDLEKKRIAEAPERAKAFLESAEYRDLQEDLNRRVASVQKEIALAAGIDNVNIRGRIIEYLITETDPSLKDQIIKALQENTPLPPFRTEDKLGDYKKIYPNFHTETDIKTKVRFLDGNPKAYNIDKLLEFLAAEKSVYLIYLLGINPDGSVTARLCSVFDARLLRATHLIRHWSGRNSRGVAQFYGTALSDILQDKEPPRLDMQQSREYLEKLMES